MFLATGSEDAALTAQLDEVHATAWEPTRVLLVSPDARQPTLLRKLAEIGAIRRPESA